MEIKHDLLPKQKTRKHNLRVEIDLYPYATELYEELHKIGIVNLKCTLCQGHYDFSFSDFYFIFVCCVEASK